MDTYDPFEGLDFTKEDVERAVQARKINNRDGRVCVCGHGIKSHSHYAPPGHPDHDLALREGRSVCIPSRVQCACGEFQPVLVTEDLRQFRHSTQGPGIDHALTLGMSASAAKGKKIEWLPGAAICVACKRGKDDGVSLTPIAYNSDMSEARNTTPQNVLICPDCREKTRRARA